MVVFESTDYGVGHHGSGWSGGACFLINRFGTVIVLFIQLS